MDGRDGPLDLPASMADIFLALVAVVILMLLSLLPAIRAPGGLAAPQAALGSWDNVAIDGEKPAIYVAASTGIERVGDKTQTGLNDILQNQPLSSGLQTAAQRGSILLVVQPDGQESAFLFASLMGSLGLAEFYQLRVDADCAYVRDPKLAGPCRHSAEASPP